MITGFRDGTTGSLGFRVEGLPAMITGFRDWTSGSLGFDTLATR